MAATFKPPPEFLVTDHPATAWSEWRQRFAIYADATDLTAKPEPTKLAVFLHVIGLAGIKIYNNFRLPPLSKLDDVLLAFDQYFRPYLNITHLSYLFFSSKQKGDQTIDQFLLELSEKASRCEFGPLTDRLIRDILICGLHDTELRQRLLALPDPPLSETSAHCRAYEQSKRQTAIMSPFLPATPTSVDTVNSRPTTRRNLTRTDMRRSQTPTTSKKCLMCGYVHRSSTCPAFGKTCNTCHGKNHFAHCCPNTQTVSMVDALVPDVPEFLVNTLTVSSNSWWRCNLSLLGNSINFKLDTGSDLNVIPKKLFDSFRTRPPLEPIKIAAKTYSGHSLPIIGKFHSSLHHLGKSCEAMFVVTRLDAQPVLSGATCLALNLLARVCSISAPNCETPESIIETFSDVFAPSLGRIKNKLYSITLRNDAVPVVSPVRKLPLALHEPIRSILAVMEQQEVITKVSEPTDWVNAILPVTKNGKIRIALDPRPLNKYIKRQHHPIPTMESIFTKIADCKIFTVLDARDAFWQMELDYPSSLLCTFATPFGRYRFLRVPYGISPAPEFQQRTMDDMCDGLEGTAAFFDDIIIAGRDLAEHNTRLSALLARASSLGLHLKAEKTQLAQASVNFVGHVLSAAGILPSPKNVDAIRALPSPTSKNELQRFLGMIGYLSKFIPNFSERTAYLRSLLPNALNWNWSSRAERDYLLLKELVSSPPLLGHFNPKLQLTMSVDASQHGLGAVLMQSGQPIHYASAKLSPAQTRYAQIEKELLAIVFGCTRFHYYTYGRPVLIETDHKPLLAIVAKPFSNISPRLQRLLLKLQLYSFELIYTPGKNLFIADTLSRSPSDLDPGTCDNVEYQVLSLTTGINFHSPMHHELVNVTSSDMTCQTLLGYVQSGWPNIKRIPETLRHFWNIRHELYQLDGLIYRGVRVLIPLAFRETILQRLHETHQGVVACKSRAREHVYWPGMSADIERYVLSCSTCQSFAPANSKEPLFPHHIPCLPWSKLAADIFKVNDSNYLLIVDYFSKFVELVPLGISSVATLVIDALKSIFARHGVPSLLVTDNGPPFGSNAFKAFADSWNFKTTTSSPTFAQSNGQAERMIRTIKSHLIKCISSGADPYRVVLNFVTTPHDQLPSPSQLLMSRRLRTSLPAHPGSLHPAIVSTASTHDQLKIRHDIQKNYYDKHTKPLRPFVVGDNVFMQCLDGTWIPAVVDRLADQPRSYWVKIKNGNILRRNRIHLRPRRTRPDAPQRTLTPPPPLAPQLFTPPFPFAEPLPLEPLPLTLPEPPAAKAPGATTSLDTIPCQTSVKPPVITRSGRTVRTPARLLD